MKKYHLAKWIKIEIRGKVEEALMYSENEFSCLKSAKIAFRSTETEFKFVIESAVDEDDEFKIVNGYEFFPLVGWLSFRFKEEYYL